MAKKTSKKSRPVAPARQRPVVARARRRPVQTLDLPVFPPPVADPVASTRKTPLPSIPPNTWPDLQAKVIADQEYQAWMRRIAERVSAVTIAGAPVFTTAADSRVWSAYLTGFPKGRIRQHHNCHACEAFLTRYGGLVIVHPESGKRFPLLWDPNEAPPLYRKAVQQMRIMIEDAPVTGQFFDAEPVWGRPRTGDWTHLHVAPVPNSTRVRVPKGASHAERRRLADARMAETLERLNMLTRSLNTITPEAAAWVTRFLSSDDAYRGEKLLGMAKWVEASLFVHRATTSANLFEHTAIMWWRVATAPAGWCHVASSVIGTLYEDLQAGRGYDEVARRFQAKMHPLSYQRPTAAPSAQTIVQAERLVQELGIEPSLRRRPALLVDIYEAGYLWRPPQDGLRITPASLMAATRRRVAGVSPGVFDHLITGGQRAGKQVGILPPSGDLSFFEFNQRVLPHIAACWVRVPVAHPAFCAFTTASNLNAPPILQWDTTAVRNPVAWYFYAAAVQAEAFNVRAGNYVKVVAVLRKPNMWFLPTLDHHGDGALFVLADARDVSPGQLILFPETLKTELHAVRSVIEAHSKSRRLDTVTRPGQRAAGLMIGQSVREKWDVTVRVATHHGFHVDYTIQRWA